MKAFLMAAGTGTRLKNVTLNPKSLLKVNNISIIKHTVKMLQEKNIEVVIVVGFKEKLIREELKEINGIEFVSNNNYINTNSIYSLYTVKEKINDECMILNADVFWEEDLLNMILEHNTENAVMLGDSSKERLINGDYFLKSKNNKIIDYGKDLSLKDRDYEYVGIAKISKKFANIFKEELERLINLEKKSLWWENVLYSLSKKYNVSIKDCNGIFWGEVDTENDYKRILNYKNKGE